MLRYPKFVIISTPHAGTRWMAKTISANGIDCRHEFFYKQNSEIHLPVYAPHGLYGTVDFAAIQFYCGVDIIVHSHRHPVTAINALIHKGGGIWRKFGTTLGVPPWWDGKYCAKQEAQWMWLRWNKILFERKEITLRWKVEAPKFQKLFELCDREWLGKEISIVGKSKHENPVTWDDLWPETQELAEELGYDQS